MATPVLNNGIFIEDIDIKIGPNLDGAHLRNLVSQYGDTQPTDLGVLDLWIYARKKEAPLYSMSSFNTSNTIIVEDPKGEFQWTLPTKNDLPYIVRDLEPSNTKKGADGHTFKLLFNKPWGNTAELTYSLSGGARVIVTGDDIVPLGKEGYVHTVKVVQGTKHKYLDNKYLSPEVKWFHASSKSGEYNQRYDTVSTQSSGKRMYNYVGNAMANSAYEVGPYADDMLRAGVKMKEGLLSVNSIWNIDFTKDPSLRDYQSMSDLVKARGKDWYKKALSDGTLTQSFVTNMEGAHIQKLVADRENELMWSPGGIYVDQETGETLRSSIGLWHQMDNGYKDIYNINSFTLDRLEAILRNFFMGKVPLDEYNPKRTIVLQVGTGAHKMITSLIEAKAWKGSTMMTSDAQKLGAVTQGKSGDAYSLHFGYGFASYTIPFLANVQLVVNEALDNCEANEIDNPMIGGHRLSSYSIIAFDIVDNANDNILLLKKKWHQDLIWRIINGKRNYMGKPQNYVSSGGNFGYRVEFEAPHDAVFVKDPTKILKLVARNPITGLGFM